MFLFINLHGVSKRTGSTRDDRDLVDRCGLCLLRSDQCMSDLVVGHDQFLLVGKHTVLLLISGNDNLDTLLEVCLCCELTSVTDSTESSFIDDVGKFCTRSTRCCLGDLVESDGVCDLDLLRMDFEDLFTSLNIRKLYRDPSVKTSRTEKCRIQGIRTVGCGKDHNTLGAVKTIHFCQKLVQCLLTLIVTTCESGTVALLTNGIDLIDEDNTRCFLIRLFKKVTDLGSTHTYKHLYKLRT